MEYSPEGKEASSNQHPLSQYPPGAKNDGVFNYIQSKSSGLIIPTADMEHSEDVGAGDQPEDAQTVAPWDQPIQTEGWRNPGWYVILCPFLVGFATTGNFFCWGIFQEQ